MSHRLTAHLVRSSLLYKLQGSGKRRSFKRFVQLLPFLMLGVSLSWAGTVAAQTSPASPAPGAELVQSAEPAPAELLDILSQIDAAASQKNLQTVLSFYSPSFSNSDGMTYDDLQRNLQQLWERFPNLTYQTQVNSWQQEQGAIVAETTTTITGQHVQDTRPETLTATITSRQRLESGKIVAQEILTEESQLAQGDNPPQIKVILPEEVTTGQQYEFDAIVQEPLGERVLLGAALEEPVKPDGYFDSLPVNLEVLNSGGLFKLGTASETPATQWISAVIIRDDGILTVTRRMRVVSSVSTTP